jgi:hypothetical protein
MCVWQKSNLAEENLPEVHLTEVHLTEVHLAEKCTWQKNQASGSALKCTWGLLGVRFRFASNSLPKAALEMMPGMMPGRFAFESRATPTRVSTATLTGYPTLSVPDDTGLAQVPTLGDYYVPHA